MKVVAHPLVVAVALGLLGPTALAQEEREDSAPDCADCGEDANHMVMSDLGMSDLAMSELAAPEEGEWHRVEQAWLEAREGF